MNIVPYRAKLPDLPLPEKRHGGAFRTIPWERYPHPREKTVEVAHPINQGENSLIL